MKMKRCFLYVSALLSAIFFSPHIKAQSDTDSLRIDLNKAIEIALSENVTMKIANREIEVKKNYKKEQIVGFFPDVSLSGSYNRTLLKQTMVMEMETPNPANPNETIVQTQEISMGTDNNWGAGVNVSLPLIVPTMWFNTKLSQLDVELTMEKARASKISLIFEVKKAYFSYLLAKDSYKVLLLNYDNVQLNFENISRKYEQGLASEFDKLRAEVQVKNQIPSIKSAERAVELSTMMLKVLIGVDIQESLIFEGTLEDFEDEMLSKSIPDVQTLSFEHNSDLKQLELSLQQMNTAMKITKSSTAPNLVFAGAFQVNSIYNDANYKGLWNPNSYVALSLNVPIVSWAGTSYKIKSNKLNIQSLEDQKSYLEDNLKISVRNSITQINSAIEELTSNKETVILAEKTYDISKKQYEVGMSTWLDLSSAEVALTNARLAYNQSIYNYLAAYAELEKTIGNN